MHSFSSSRCHSHDTHSCVYISFAHESISPRADMVRKSSIILCGHIESQAWSETWWAVTVLVCFRGPMAVELSAIATMALGKLRWMVTPSRFNSVQFSHSVVSDSLRPHESQHARPPCPSPTPGVYSNSCPLSWWCHPTISSSVVPFSSLPQSFPPSGSFQMSQFFHQVARVLELQLQHQSFQRIFRTDL